MPNETHNPMIIAAATVSLASRLYRDSLREVSMFESGQEEEARRMLKAAEVFVILAADMLGDAAVGRAFGLGLESAE